MDDTVFRSWQKKGIRNVTRRADGKRIVQLTEDLNCPHLAENGLCRIITKYGEKMTPESCRAFPREIREFPGRRETSLMLACPAVIDLLKDGFNIVQENDPDDMSGTEKLRNCWMQTIRESNVPEEAFLRLFRVPEHLPPVPAYAQMEEEAQLYADLTENYREEGLYRRFWEEEDHWPEESNTDRKDPELWKIHAELILNCILSDVWSECLKPGFTEREMLLKLQWIALKYTAVRHFLRIRSSEGGMRTVRDGIVLMTRIMSMDDEEIFAWLLDMFDGEIWKPEYPALLFR